MNRFSSTIIGLFSVCLLALSAQHVLAKPLTLDDVMAAPALNTAIPRPEQVLSVGVGERHLYHHEIVSYLDALASASPRMQALPVDHYTYGGRALVSYVISSPANLAKLDDIVAARATITDPDSNVDMSNQPVVLHMMYSIHGNEPSGTNATPLVAYYLTAAEDPALLSQLEQLVIVLTPMQNPDGLDRFAHWTNSHRGLVPSTDPNDREHEEATPNGRTNYYGFDLNRDWLAHQHPASRHRLSIFHTWKPNVQLDFHEQGSNSHFFFMPGKPERTNPLTPAINQELTGEIGAYHARMFDSYGTPYFTEERYDDFFMGKGSTYPDLFGSVGILFEQPSSRGAQQDTVNGLLTFPDTITNQFRTSLSSIEATVALKDELQQYQQQFYADVQNSGRRGYYLASANGDPTRIKEFVRVLQGHDIQVELLTEDVNAEGKTFKANEAIAIPLQQPQSTYLATLWNSQLEFEENVFYDVSTWTMPWAFNVTHTREPVRRASTQALPDNFLSTERTFIPSNIGYLIDWRDSSVPKLLYGLLEADANVRVAQAPFTGSVLLGDSPKGTMLGFGYGTLLVTPSLDKAIPDAAMKLLQEATEQGLPVYPVASSYTSSGADLGSRSFQVLKLPKVLLVTGPGTSAYDVGELWHLLDRHVQMPVTMVDSYRLASTKLSDYSHIVMTNPLPAIAGDITDDLDDFVSAGGVLWAQGSATVKWLQKLGLTEAVWRDTEQQQLEAQYKELKDKGVALPEELEALMPKRLPYKEAEDEAAFRLVRGAILEGNIDTSHPLGYGYEDATLPVFRRSAAFMNRSANPYSSPVVYTNNPLLSGYMSDENRALAANSAGLVVDARGKGAIVQSLDSPVFRAFWWGSQRLFINGLFFGELLDEPR